jgi:probable HAF family extracellular repeat protein
MIVCASSCLLTAIACGGQAESDAPNVGVTESTAEKLTTDTRYTITTVQPLSGDANTYAFAINDAGTVTGVSSPSNTTTGRAIRVPAGGASQNLGTLRNGPYSVGRAINAAGQVAGNCYVSSVNAHACLFTDGKGWIDLGVINVGKEDPTTQPSSAGGLNTAGTVAGTAPWLDPVSFNQFNHAFTYTNGTKKDLSTLIGQDGTSTGMAINDNGVVAGSSTSSTGNIHAALWSGSTISDLGVLPVALTSGATAVNASGHAVGISGRPNCQGYQCSPQGFQHAFLYTPSSGLVDLGTLGGNASTALGIDAADEVVGSSSPTGVANPNHADPNRLAFIYTGGKMVDLNTRIDASGWVLTEATGINSKGQIVGNGKLNGVFLAFVLTPR